MAKRSIEIVISAENRTGTALQQAKAELAGYAADVKRIQSNIAAATRAGDTGAAAGQMGLLGGAQERQATLRQEVEGRAALSARLAAYKAEHAAIRASVGATDELAGSHAKVSAEIARSNAGMEKSVLGAIRFGKAMVAARIATDAIEAVASALEGDFSKAAAALERTPIIGELIGGGKAGFHLGKALARNVDEKLHPNTVVEEAVSRGLNEASAAKMSLAQITDESQRRVRIAGMSEEEKGLFLLNEERKKAIAGIKALGMAEERLLTGKPQEAKALAAIESEYDSRAARIKQKTADDHAADVIAATKEREDREAEEQRAREKVAADQAAKQKRKEQAEDLEETRQRERLNVEYNNMLSAAAAKGEREERAAAATREAANAEYNNMLAAAEERAVEPMFRGGVAAFDRGFLTQAPGSTFDQSATATATAKATETTAKATEKTAKAVETLTARQELLFRELLTAWRPGKVINF